MIRKAIIGLAIIVVGGGLVYGITQGNKTTVENKAPDVITNTVTQEIDVLNAEIEKAIKASSTEITTQAQGAYDATVEKLEKEIELRVRQEQKERLDSQIQELEKQIGVF